MRKRKSALNDLMGVEVIFVDSDSIRDLYAEINRISDELRLQARPLTLFL